MNKLTNEEIAKVFMLYNGCRVVHPKYKQTYLNEDSALNEWFASSMYSKKNPDFFNDRKLCLISLNKITDEHAIEVACILDVGGDCVERHKDHIAVYDRYNDNANDINTLRLHFINNYELLHIDEQGRGYEFDLTRCSFVHQYLISKGYDVPLFFANNHWANCKTAIELGIAIEKS